MMDEELARFKTDIDLVDFMAANGCNIVRRYTNSVELRGHGGKFYVRKVGNDYVYKDFLNDKGGTIIDFCQQYLMAGNLGEVRKMLRDYSGIRVESNHQQRVQREKPKEKIEQKEVEKNLEKIQEDMRNFRPTDGKHSYLRGERKISVGILRDERFADRVLADYRGNAIFPHRGKAVVNGKVTSIITGYEIKNKGFTGFSAGGEKGLWYSSNATKAQKIIIVESAIDAMSHAQIKKTDMSVGYVSIGGAMSEKQKELLKSVIAKAHARGAEIVLGLDNDAAGDKMSQQVRDLARECGVMTIKREVPMTKDWNDDLKEKIKKMEEDVKKYKEDDKIYEKVNEDIQKNYKVFLIGGGREYLKQKGISNETIENMGFGRYIHGDKNSVIFPYRDHHGICGCEKDTKAGITYEGAKGLWCTEEILNVPKIIITENAIDALSHAQIRKSDITHTGYISVGGQEINEKQEALLKSLIEKANSQGTEIVIAVGNDALAQRIEALAKECGVISMVRETPMISWNEDLKQHQLTGESLGEWKKEESHQAQAQMAMTA